MAVTVNSRPSQEADFQCDGPARRSQLAATSGKTRSRPLAGAYDRQVPGIPIRSTACRVDLRGRFRWVSSFDRGARQET